MEVVFNLLLYIIIAVILIVVVVFFYLYIKGEGIDVLTAILDIPNYLKKLFGG